MLSLILAAGKGTRMKSNIPKVLHKVNGVSMLQKVTNVMQDSGIENKVYIIGHMKDKVLQEMGDIEYIEQDKQLGTGHAILISQDKIKKYNEDVLIVYGDSPLLKVETIKKLKDKFYKNSLDCILLSCEVKDPTGYGRIIKDKDNKVIDIIEENEASEEVKKINEMNVGVYIFKHEKLLQILPMLKNDNQKGEYYLTDAIKLLVKDNAKVESYKIEDEEEILGVNSKVQLEEVGRILRDRKNKELMDNGVIIIDKNTTYIEDTVEIGPDTVIYPNVIIEGKTKIGGDTIILSNTRIENSIIGSDVRIESSVIEKSTLDDKVTVGPFAHIRPNSILKEQVHVGNFVEIKNAQLEKGVKTGHLTYIGDSIVGEDTNIGAGTITCNYDGKNKHRTIIGKSSFVGSNTIFIAPVEIGENSYTAAGSVITKDVPEESIAFGRAKQINKKRSK